MRSTRWPSCCRANPNVTNFAGFYEELLARERIESTCLGNEIAFPHARTDFLKGMVLAIGRSPQGVWFENSGQTVKLIFVIGTPKRMVTDYLSVVGGLARLLKDASTRESLIAAPNVEEFIATLTQPSWRGNSSFAIHDAIDIKMERKLD